MPMFSLQQFLTPMHQADPVGAISNASHAIGQGMQNATTQARNADLHSEQVARQGLAQQSENFDEFNTNREFDAKEMQSARGALNAFLLAAADDPKRAPLMKPWLESYGISVDGMDGAPGAGLPPGGSPQPVGQSPSAPQMPQPASMQSSPGLPAQQQPQDNGFNSWYSKVSTAKGLDPNPDNPEHHYDYRKFYEAVRAGRMPDVGMGPDDHFPSEFKTAGHPREVLVARNGRAFNTVTGTYLDDGSPVSQMDMQGATERPQTSTVPGAEGYIADVAKSVNGGPATAGVLPGTENAGVQILQQLMGIPGVTRATVKGAVASPSPPPLPKVLEEPSTQEQPAMPLQPAAPDAATPGGWRFSYRGRPLGSADVQGFYDLQGQRARGMATGLQGLDQDSIGVARAIKQAIASGAIRTPEDLAPYFQKDLLPLLLQNDKSKAAAMIAAAKGGTQETNWFFKGLETARNAAKDRGFDKLATNQQMLEAAAKDLSQDNGYLSMLRVMQVYKTVDNRISDADFARTAGYRGPIEKFQDWLSTATTNDLSPESKTRIMAGIKVMAQGNQELMRKEFQGLSQDADDMPNPQARDGYLSGLERFMRGYGFDDQVANVAGNPRERGNRAGGFNIPTPEGKPRAKATPKTSTPPPKAAGPDKNQQVLDYLKKFAD